jgi:hypothetical protein
LKEVQRFGAATLGRVTEYRGHQFLRLKTKRHQLDIRITPDGFVRLRIDGCMKEIRLERKEGVE